MLSKYLQIPLRYDLVHVSSRSFVLDKVEGVSREYPLYRKYVDRERFHRGLLYLDRDVQQVNFVFNLNLNFASCFVYLAVVCSWFKSS